MSRFQIQKPRELFPPLSVGVSGVFQTRAGGNYEDVNELIVTPEVASDQILKVAKHFESAPGQGTPTTCIKVDRDGVYSIKLNVKAFDGIKKMPPTQQQSILAVIEYHWYSMTKEDGTPGCGVYAKLKGF